MVIIQESTVTGRMGLMARWMLALCLMLQCVVGSKSVKSVRVRRSDDPHGGVPMGIINPVCDDAKQSLEIDWDPNSTEEYTCDDGQTFQPAEKKFMTNCTDNLHQPIHVCLPNQISYPDNEIPPTSGPHRPVWPDYGEYKYLPTQRWLHNLEHGAIVFLYHPCADSSEVDKMREVATGCLRKHIITPYKLLPPETPFAAVSWGCKLLMSHVETPLLIRFVKDHALKAPEGDVARKGQYTVAMETPAKVVSDYNDREICPDRSRVQHEESARTLGPQDQGSLPALGLGAKPPSDVPYGIADNPFGGAKATGDGLFQKADDPDITQFQEQRRRLSEEGTRLRENVQHLIRAFKKLTETK